MGGLIRIQISHLKSNIFQDPRYCLPIRTYDPIIILAIVPESSDSWFLSPSGINTRAGSSDAAEHTTAAQHDANAASGRRTWPPQPDAPILAGRATAPFSEYLLLLRSSACCYRHQKVLLGLLGGISCPLSYSISVYSSDQYSNNHSTCKHAYPGPSQLPSGRQGQ